MIWDVDATTGNWIGRNDLIHTIPSPQFDNSITYGSVRQKDPGDGLDELAGGAAGVPAGVDGAAGGLDEVHSRCGGDLTLKIRR